MYLLFDIGATKIRMAFTPDLEKFEEPEIIKTPDDFDEALKRIQMIGNDLAKGRPFEGVVGGIAGARDKDSGNFIYSNKPKWIGRNFERSVRELLYAPVRARNDAAIVGLGEAVHGAGKGENIVAYITVSSGVGGSKIVNGEIDPVSSNLEPGHQIIDAGGCICDTCGTRGDLEAYVGGKSLAKRYGKSPKEIDDENVWNELARWLSYGLNNSILHWSPDILVLGGSMITGDPAIPMKEIIENVNEVMDSYYKPPRIVKAKLGDLGGLYGALVYARTIHGRK